MTKQRKEIHKKTDKPSQNNKPKKATTEPNFNVKLLCFYEQKDQDDITSEQL